ncbi:hypothetical protein WEI85_31680 [Actinomycetes bacterium KLBMP 9797]
MRKVLTLLSATVLTTSATLLSAGPASAAAYTVWSDNSNATTTYHTGKNRIVVCDRSAVDGRSAYGSLYYWDGSKYIFVGEARDRDGGQNESCAEFVGGAGVPDNRWLWFNSCTAKFMDGQWYPYECNSREVYDDGSS